VNHVALDSEFLFWLMAGLTLLLLMFIVAILRTPSEPARSPQPPVPARPAPPRPPPAPLAGWPLPVPLAGEAARPGRPGYRPRHAGAPEPDPATSGRSRASGGPPWGPAPLPPGPPGSYVLPPLPLPDQGPRKARAHPAGQPEPSQLRHASGRFPPGAHRHESRLGAHRADTSIDHARRSAGRAGRHRAGAH
jgi:hypothetical protein